MSAIAPPPDATPLPLSWAVDAREQPNVQFRLTISGADWLAYQTLPVPLPPAQLLDQLRTRRNHFLIRGVNPQLWAHWQHTGLHAITSGLEARLPAYPVLWGKSSLRALARRGLRHGRLRELPAQTPHMAYADFRDATNIGHRPLLRGMFRSQPADAQRLFVLQSDAGDWLGLVTLTRNSPHYWHVELLQRRSDAPIGVMEALLLSLYAQLHAETPHNRLSLGEVPFMHPGDGFMSKLTRLAGKAVRPGYDYVGLYNFKNKFLPEWQPLRIVCTRTITPLTMAELMFATGAQRVMWAGWWG